MWKSLHRWDSVDETSLGPGSSSWLFVISKLSDLSSQCGCDKSQSHLLLVVEELKKSPIQARVVRWRRRIHGPFPAFLCTSLRHPPHLNISPTSRTSADSSDAPWAPVVRLSWFFFKHPVTLVFLIPASRYPHSLRIDHPPRTILHLLRVVCGLKPKLRSESRWAPPSVLVHHPVPCLYKRGPIPTPRPRHKPKRVRGVRIGWLWREWYPLRRPHHPLAWAYLDF